MNIFVVSQLIAIGSQQLILFGRYALIKKVVNQANYINAFDALMPNIEQF